MQDPNTPRRTSPIDHSSNNQTASDANQESDATLPPAATGGKSDEDLREIWRAAGGRFHGPIVETGTMPEAKLLPFLRSLLEGKAAT